MEHQISDGLQLSLIEDEPKLSMSANSHHSYLTELASINFYDGTIKKFEIFYDRDTPEEVEVTHKNEKDKYTTEHIRLVGRIASQHQIDFALISAVQTVMVKRGTKQAYTSRRPDRPRRLSSDQQRLLINRREA